MSNLDFCYAAPTDERLKRLDDLRRFLIMLRDAPTVPRRGAEPDSPPHA
jgi:hypothetical protein